MKGDGQLSRASRMSRNYTLQFDNLIFFEDVSSTDVFCRGFSIIR
nr:MAG TPA: hypothetical protein [Caudoviricetes sp.]